MVLVAYSDSEGSDADEQHKPTIKPNSQLTQTGADFSVNKGNPRKIQVSLAPTSNLPSDREEDGRPAPKRARIGDVGLGGFNAMLPAPKRDNEKKPPSSAPARKVFSLKTGAEPGFSREADAEMKELFAQQIPPPQTALPLPLGQEGDSPAPVKMGSAVRFKPLSVARNAKKRPASSTQTKKGSIMNDQGASQEFPSVKPAPPAPKSKISLFSAEPERAHAILADHETVEVEEEIDQGAVEQFESPEQNTGNLSEAAPYQSLDTIASDLNLSAADRRRLFGREGKGSNSAINIVNFNTDHEYAANEVLRASGEQAQHHAVRGIAPGKHSLKQLVNAATTQKEALEESFAAGKSNKREAGNRYGW